MNVFVEEQFFEDYCEGWEVGEVEGGDGYVGGFYGDEEIYLVVGQEQVVECQVQLLCGFQGVLGLVYEVGEEVEGEYCEQCVIEYDYFGGGVGQFVEYFGQVEEEGVVVQGGEGGMLIYGDFLGQVCIVGQGFVEVGQDYFVFVIVDFGDQDF